MNTQRIRGAAAGAVALTLLVAACGSDDDGGNADSGSDDTTAAGGTTAGTTSGDTGTTSGDAGTTSGDGGAATGGDCDELEPISLQLQWVTQAQFGGYFAAVDQGFYEDRCLDVTIVEGGVEIVPQTQLANGDVDFALGLGPEGTGKS